MDYQKLAMDAVKALSLQLSANRQATRILLSRQEEIDRMQQRTLPLYGIVHACSRLLSALRSQQEDIQMEVAALEEAFRRAWTEGVVTEQQYLDATGGGM